MATKLLKGSSRGRSVLLTLLILTGCGVGDGPASTEGGESEAVQSPSPSGRSITQAATDVVGFLQGDVSFDQLKVASEVTLHLASEGGGDRVVLEREDLEDPQNWHVRSDATGIDYSFVPPPEATELVVRPDIHFNCLEYDLSTRAEGVANQPHAGAMLTPVDSDSCLQSWNVTFLFDPDQNQPRLLGAVYDQWEW